MRRREVAREIRAAARAWAERAEWEDDAKAARVFRADARALVRVSRLVDQGRVAQAAGACNLDTVVREQLPSSFFELLKRHGVPW